MIITHITLEIELFTTSNYFGVQLKLKELMGAPFLLELVVVVSYLSQL